MEGVNVQRSVVVMVSGSRTIIVINEMVLMFMYRAFNLKARGRDRMVSRSSSDLTALGPYKNTRIACPRNIRRTVRVRMRGVRERYRGGKGTRQQELMAVSAPGLMVLAAPVQPTAESCLLATSR